MHAANSAEAGRLPPLPSRAATRIDRIAMVLMAFPVACFTLALATDITYWRTSFLMWHNFSAWLLFAGVLGCGLALAVGIIGLFFRPRARPVAFWIGVAIVFVLAFFNNLVHAGDGWTAIVPTGLSLSAATVLALILTAWLGRDAAPYGAYRHV